MHKVIKLEKLLHLIGQDEVIQRYQAIEEKVKKNKKLTELVEEIKVRKKMRFNLLTMANQLLKKKPFNELMRKQKEFDEHPLVVAYREQLIEANDLSNMSRRSFNTA